MKDKPKGATHYNKYNYCFYKPSSDNAEDGALFICLHKPNLKPPSWRSAERFKNKALDNNKIFEKV